MTLSAKTNPISLGEDRAYRRYWMFASVAGLFVEDDEPYPGLCCDIPTRDVVDVRPDACQATLVRLLHEAKSNIAPELAKEDNNIEEKANTSDKENDGQLNGVLAEANVKNPAVSLNVTNIINRVILTPPPPSNTNKLNKSNSINNATPKTIQKSSKDQSITKFFSKSPKCPSSSVNGSVVITEEKPQVNGVLEPSESKPEVMEVDPKPVLNGEEAKPDVKEEPEEIFGLCTTNPETCPVHTEDTKRPKWSFYYREEDIDAIINGLNERGERESVLKENLVLFKSIIEANMKNCPVFILNPTQDSEQDTMVRKSKRMGGKKGGDGDTNLNFPISTPIDQILNLTLRDMILEVEEKLYVGVLGRLQVTDRDTWRQVIAGESQNKLEHGSLSWGGKKRIAQFRKDLGIEPTLSEDMELSDKEDTSDSVRMLAIALLQVAQSIDMKYLKPPLAETDKIKDKRCKAERRLQRLVEKRDKKKEEQLQQQQENGTNNSDNSDSESECGDDSKINSFSENVLRLPLERWEISLMTSVSFSQVFLHLATLDNSVTWSRSLTKTRCRICRKGGDHEKMLLCDGCDKGHHMYCLKPKLKSIPEGDWFCDKCKPKLKPKSPKKSRTIYVEEDEEEEEVDNQEEVEEAEEQVEEEDEEEEEEDEGAGYEDDVCVECNTGGTLICCDTCPRSYHQECALLKKIPRGNWSCPQCSAPKKTSSKASDENSSKSRKSDTRKSGGGSSQRSSKRSSPCSPESDDNAPAKRRRTDKNNAEPEQTNGRGRRGVVQDTADLHSSDLLKLLADAAAHDEAWPFLKPVNKKQVSSFYLTRWS